MKPTIAPTMPTSKGKIDATPDQRHKPYHKVWDVMADALGAYGSPGRNTPQA